MGGALVLCHVYFLKGRSASLIEWSERTRWKPECSLWSSLRSHTLSFLQYPHWELEVSPPRCETVNRRVRWGRRETGRVRTIQAVNTVLVTFAFTVGSSYISLALLTLARAHSRDPKVCASLNDLRTSRRRHLQHDYYDYWSTGRYRAGWETAHL